ncbi:MAG: ATP synthase F1 subunit gamma [Candidatus Omnitrophica bacterium]|nr:ATP synthase F1 subunit gamma [Candidatus Omnitrophota bacterium]
MSNLRVIRQRIRSVQSTQKITKAMQMVAGAKLRRMQDQLTGFKPYAYRLEEITRRFLSAYPGLEHPLLGRAGSAEGKPAGLVLIASDTGLCGTYNERILSAAERFFMEFPSAKLVTIGKKGSRRFAKRGIHQFREILDWGGKFDFEKMLEFMRWLQEVYLRGEVSAWYVAYTRFISAMQWKPAIERVLPLEPAVSQNQEPEKLITEPQPEFLADEILRRNMEAALTRILLEAFTSEHSARMIAMKNATENATEMIDTLTLVRNKVRQAAITKELIEVVSGAQALR